MKRKLLDLFEILLASMVTLVGLAALIGYVLHQPWLFGWQSGSVPMALNTALAVTATGIALGVRLLRRPFYPKQGV